MKIQTSTLLLIAISLSFISQTAVNCQSITYAEEGEQEEEEKEQISYGMSDEEEEEGGETNSSTKGSSQTGPREVSTPTQAGKDESAKSINSSVDSGSVDSGNTNDGYQILAFIVVMIPLTLISSI